MNLKYLLLTLASIASAWATDGGNNTEILRGQQFVPTDINMRRQLKKAPKTPESTLPPALSPETPSASCMGEGESCQGNTPPCCRGYTCTGSGGSKACTGPPYPTLHPTPKQVDPGQCPQCIASQGGCSCDADWSTSSLECVTNPQASELKGYSSNPIYDENGKMVVKGTSIFTNSFSAGWACHDGYGGYYSGGFCYTAHGAACNCADGYVWTNAATCLPLVCDPTSTGTPDRCTCTLDDSCECDTIKPA